MQNKGLHLQLINILMFLKVTRNTTMSIYLPHLCTVCDKVCYFIQTVS